MARAIVLALSLGASFRAQVYDRVYGEHEQLFSAAKCPCGRFCIVRCVNQPGWMPSPMCLVCCNCVMCRPIVEASAKRVKTARAGGGGPPAPIDAVEEPAAAVELVAANAAAIAERAAADAAAAAAHAARDPYDGLSPELVHLVAESTYWVPLVYDAGKILCTQPPPGSAHDYTFKTLVRAMVRSCRSCIPRPPLPTPRHATHPSLPFIFPS